MLGCDLGGWQALFQGNFHRRHEFLGFLGTGTVAGQHVRVDGPQVAAPMVDDYESGAFPTDLGQASNDCGYERRLPGFLRSDAHYVLASKIIPVHGPKFRSAHPQQYRILLGI